MKIKNIDNSNVVRITLEENHFGVGLDILAEILPDVPEPVDGGWVYKVKILGDYNEEDGVNRKNYSPDLNLSDTDET